MDFKEEIDKLIKDSKRVLKVSKKPDCEEYMLMAKVTLLGLVVIGCIGFLIVLLGQLIGL
ncbi:MAG: protein translocase SEC61 complex subunit gamma [archaeon]|nr:protein translocase SEC61 complex subunit gamma [archaeon]